MYNLLSPPCFRKKLCSLPTLLCINFCHSYTNIRIVFCIQICASKPIPMLGQTPYGGWPWFVCLVGTGPPWYCQENKVNIYSIQDSQLLMALDTEIFNVYNPKDLTWPKDGMTQSPTRRTRPIPTQVQGRPARSPIWFQSGQLNTCLQQKPSVRIPAQRGSSWTGH